MTRKAIFRGRGWGRSWTLLLNPHCFPCPQRVHYTRLCQLKSVLVYKFCLSVSLLIHSGDHLRRLQTSSPIGGYAKKQSDVWLCYSVSRIASLATRNEGSRPQATIRQSGKYHSILGGASCKRDFCILLCSLRELKMQRIRCNFKRSGCIARSNRAKSKGYCLLEFKENYGVFRIGQFRSSFDR